MAGLYGLSDDLAARNRFGFDQSILGLDGFTTQDYDQNTTSIAGFGTITFDLTAALKLTVGGRYTYEEKKFNQENFLVPSANITAFRTFDRSSAIPLVPYLSGKKSWKEWSGRWALDYQVTDDVLIYGNVNRGFRSGGILFPNSFINSEGLDPYDPEILWAYEVGFKSDLFDKRARLNVSGFYYEHVDHAVQE